MENMRSPGPDDRRDVNLAKSAYVLIILIISLTLIQIGKSFLIPLILSLLAWSLLNALSNHIMDLRIGSITTPRWLATLLSIMLLGLFLLGIYQILASQAADLTKAAPVYQANFTRLLNDLVTWLGIEQLPTSGSFIDSVNIGSILSLVGASIGSIFTSIILIVIYTGFLFAEQKVIPAKRAKLFTDDEHQGRTNRLFTEIASQVQRYILMKTAISLLTGLLSYIVLKLVGVDFAAVWALLIFLLNYIPNIGSFLGVAFPALLTLVQFDTLTPFLITTLSLLTIQIIVGNVIEPAYMGKSLNLSPLMIILSLTFWGILWGIPGMFLSVPLMVVTTIICSRFESLRWVAVVLSADGTVNATENSTQDVSTT